MQFHHLNPLARPLYDPNNSSDIILSRQIAINNPRRAGINTPLEAKIEPCKRNNGKIRKLPCSS